MLFGAGIYVNYLRKLKYWLFFENFIDIGSGKGKAYFYAHTSGLFNSIIGIEFSEPLFKIANLNDEKFKSKNISLINSEANFFHLPNQENLIFLFNLFDNMVLENFRSINKKYFRKYNCIIAYMNDVHLHSLISF
jgi:ubiquinone/menaquinone biosynthesis C-methylase UbiE